MSTKTQSSLDELRLAIHGVTAPFSCAGTVTPKSPVTFVFRDGFRFAVNRAMNAFAQKAELEPLLKRCRPASFGDGKKTRYDPTVRDALQLNAEGGDFTIEGFDPESAGILKKVQRQLLPQDTNPLTADLYSVNVYVDGGHFAPHKDTPRGSDMVGSLVVCLPSQFNSGQFILSHRGIVVEHDWGAAIKGQKSPAQLHWAALFGDVNHQVERVWGGARVTLAYLLRRGSGGLPAPSPGGELEPRTRRAWEVLLADEEFLPKGGVLGYPCCHLYHQDARFQAKPVDINEESAAMLKGRDQLTARSALAAGLSASFVPYLFENECDETWQLERFPTSKEKSKLRRQVEQADIDRALPVRAHGEDGANFGVTWLEKRPSGASGDPDLPAAAPFHSCEYCPWGYFGNEAGDANFYTFAALHINIPQFGQGTRRGAGQSGDAVPSRGRAVRKGKPEKK
jgi:hypothetical protein